MAFYVPMHTATRLTLELIACRFAREIRGAFVLLWTLRAGE